MSVSLRVTGAWAELVADGSVAIPATPQAGDRMYLFARWKDFSVTATVANWTAVLTPFADGAVGTGNGTGSVKVGCWYRDWQSGDTDPSIDFSAAPENASVVIMVMAKGADDVWLTPVAVTAAMTNWTTTSQIVAASSTVAVKSDGVVMGLIGLRDDSATMTRPTTGIDDSAGVVTWNGNYVESPATHHSTTTGDDGAADLGYRLVTTGVTATLRMTGTISAAETGAALWVVQGISVVVTPGIATLTFAPFAPGLRLTTIPTTATLSATSFAPQLHERTTPATTALLLATSAPVLNQAIIPDAASLSFGSFAPGLHEQVTPPAISLTLTSFAPAPTILFTVIPDPSSLVITPHAVSLSYGVIPATANLVISIFRASVLPFRIVYADPGGDAVQAAGHFNTDINATGLITFDPTQKVVGVGSYKFDSGDGTLQPIAEVAGVLGDARRVSCYFRYDLVPDAVETNTPFAESALTAYSGGGFADTLSFANDDGLYATATPAKNAGQGTVFGFPALNVPIGAVIDSVKIIYERKYDVDTSIGISRVKTRVNGEEGPNHDNTDMPLTDTVVEVDVTGDRGWTWQDLQDGVFQIIAEARRGDTDTEHIQSWDYLKVEVVYHLANVILRAANSGDQTGFSIAITPHSDGVTLRFADGAGDSFDGITKLPINTWNRISFGYIQHAVDNLGIKIYLNGIEELSIDQSSTGGFSGLSKLLYGWIVSPGVDHLCWLDQLYIDDGDDLSDPKDPRSTHKGPATVNENNWNTTVGTGAANERPLSETNHMKHTSVTGVRQTYTLETLDEGDVDLTGEILIGYMGWAWAKLGGTDTGDALALVVNNVEVNQNAQITTSPSLLRYPVTSVDYPSHAAGIGMVSNDEASDTFLHECGVVQAHEGPDINPNRILAYQLLEENTILDLVDDLRGDPPESYEFCYRSSESETAAALITVSSLDQEGGSIQWQIGNPDNPFSLSGGSGQTRIPAGIEVQIHIEIIGGPLSLGLWHRVDFD